MWYLRNETTLLDFVTGYWDFGDGSGLVEILAKVMIGFDGAI